LMFDYKRGYAADLESSGIMDIFRLPKFSFYFYQSQNGPDTDENGFGKPMLFIANYWNDPKQTDIKIFSNCEQVELFLNGRSLGIQKPDTDANSKNLLHPPFTFYPAKYEPGTLTAIGYINSKKIVRDSVSTPGVAHQILIKPDLSGKDLAAGKNDAIFIYAYITDKNGNVLANASGKVKFSVEGEGAIIGPSEINVEAGIATILLRAGEMPGKIKITAAGDGLIPGEFVCTVK